LEISAAFNYIRDFLWTDHRIRYMDDKPTQRKKGEHSRLEMLEPHARNGRIYFLDGQTELRDQHRTYPRGADDLMDAEEKAVRVRGTLTPRHAIVKDEPEKHQSRMYFDPALV
jgi:hypothetical protein